MMFLANLLTKMLWSCSSTDFNFFSPYLHICKCHQVPQERKHKLLVFLFYLIEFSTIWEKNRNYMSQFLRLKKQLERHTLTSLEPRPLLIRPTVLSFITLLVKLFIWVSSSRWYNVYHYRDYNTHADTTAITLRVPGYQQLINLYKFRDQVWRCTLIF